MASTEKDASPYDAILLKNIAEHLIDNRVTVAVAESITSGSLQLAFSQAEGATLFFQGGITTYQGAHKSRLLEVEPIHGGENEYVNPIVAQQMAEAACTLFLSQYAIGVTGFAVPLPGDANQHPYAFYAFAKEGRQVRSGRIETDQKPIATVQKEFAKSLLTLFLQLLEEESSGNL